jgi:two-component system CheB/CheR fusion protein
MRDATLEAATLYPLQHDDRVCEPEPARRECVGCSLVHEREELAQKVQAWRSASARHFITLTKREREIMDLVLAGCPSKNIAADLGISQRTVENHRAAIMKKTGAKSLPVLARLAFVAGWVGASGQNSLPVH